MGQKKYPFKKKCNLKILINAVLDIIWFVFYNYSAMEIMISQSALFCWLIELKCTVVPWWSYFQSNLKSELGIHNDMCV